MKKIALDITSNRMFEFAIMIIIIVNSVLIGVETYVTIPTISLIQNVILGIFTVEIILRFIASDSIASFFKSGWNIFDLSIVLIGYIPESLFVDSSSIMALRVLRVFRVLRLLRASKEIKLIVTVLVKSMTSMLYNLILFIIFIYLYAIIGVSLFKLPNPESLSPNERIRFERFMKEAPNAPIKSPDPFGTLGEASFTLFRVLTGEDWTDIRYNHITASEYGFIKASPSVITIYHVSWFVLLSICC